MSSAPPLPAWSFQEAEVQSNAAEAAQIAAEAAYEVATQDAAKAEDEYRRHLAAKLLNLKADGESVTAAGDIARGDPQIATLRYERDVAKGVREAAKAALFRHQANRHDVRVLIEWAHRAEARGQ